MKYYTCGSPQWVLLAGKYKKSRLLMYFFNFNDIAAYFSIEGSSHTFMNGDNVFLCVGADVSGVKSGKKGSSPTGK